MSCAEYEAIAMMLQMESTAPRNLGNPASTPSNPIGITEPSESANNVRLRTLDIFSRLPTEILDMIYTDVFTATLVAGRSDYGRDKNGVPLASKLMTLFHVSQRHRYAALPTLVECVRIELTACSTAYSGDLWPSDSKAYSSTTSRVCRRVSGNADRLRWLVMAIKLGNVLGGMQTWPEKRGQAPWPYGLGGPVVRTACTLGCLRASMTINLTRIGQCDT